MGRDPGGEKRSGWDELTDFQQQRAAKVITDFAEENGSVEADMLRKDWGDDRAFAKSIYDQYSQGNIFLEQAETYLPGTKSLAEMLDREFNPDYKEPENWMSNKREAQAERAPVLRESKETVNRPRFSVAEETDRKAVEDMTAQELRRAVAEDKADVNFYEKALALNIPEETKAEMRTKLTEIRERLGKEQARVREIEQKAREERKAAEKRERKRVAPTQAKKDFRKRLLPRRCTATTRLSRATTPPPTPTAATPTRRRVYTT